MGEVELATVSFGQSFQITPIQLAATVSGIINGGKRVTPHFAVAVQSPDGRNIKELSYPVEQGILSEATSRRVRNILEKVVSEGSGKNAKIEGYLSEGKQLPHRLFPEVLTDIFLLFLALHQQKSPLFWDFVLFTIPRECITEAP